MEKSIDSVGNEENFKLDGQEEDVIDNAPKIDETLGQSNPIAGSCGNHGSQLRTGNKNEEEVKEEQVEPAKSATGIQSYSSNVKSIEHFQPSHHTLNVSETNSQFPNNCTNSTDPARGVPMVHGSRKRGYNDEHWNQLPSHKRNSYATSKGSRFAFVNVELMSPNSDARLQAEARRLNVSVSTCSSTRMPCGNNRYVQVFMVRGTEHKRRLNEERVREDDWKDCWNIENLVKNNASPFFWGLIRESQVFKLILCASKLSNDEKDTSRLSGVLGSIGQRPFMSRFLQDGGFTDCFKRKLNNEGHREWQKLMEWVNTSDGQRLENDPNAPGLSKSHN